MKKQEVAKKMPHWTKFAAPEKLSGKKYSLHKRLNELDKGKSAQTPLKHKDDFEGQKTYKEEDK